MVEYDPCKIEVVGSSPSYSSGKIMMKNLDTKSKQELIDIIYKLCNEIIETKAAASANVAVQKSILERLYG